MTDQKSKIYDVIIIGGGLSGLSMACLLGQRNLKIVCFDRVDATQKPQDLRTTVISYGSRKILDHAGIWDKIVQTCALNDIDILDGHSPVLLNFNVTENDKGESFGWNIDNHDLKSAMLARIKELENVDYIAPVEIKSFTVSDKIAQVMLADGKTLDAKLLIGADGRGSALRGWMEKYAELNTRKIDYAQRAVICMVTHENPHDHIAIEHFWPEGPFAVLPFADDQDGKHRSSVVFTEHGPEKHSLMYLSDEEFEIALAARFPKRYGDIKLASKRARYPLGLVHADRYIAPRMALVADAAHGIHPIAGQGLNLGFRDLERLNHLIGDAIDNNQDIGSLSILEEYQRARRPDNMAMIAATDSLNRLFGNNITPIKLARRIGLRTVSKLRPAKRFFMRQAMGDR